MRAGSISFIASATKSNCFLPDLLVCVLCLYTESVAPVEARRDCFSRPIFGAATWLSLFQRGGMRLLEDLAVSIKAWILLLLLSLIVAEVMVVIVM